MPDVITELRSYRKVLDERATEVTLTEITTHTAIPPRPSSRPWPVLAASLAIVLVVALAILLSQSGETPPADSVAPTTVVTQTTTPNTTPATQATDSGDGPSLVGDDEVILAMAQSFPLRQYPEVPRTNRPDEELGQTAGFRTAGNVDGPGDAEPLGQFSVEFMAFETEGLASAYLEAQPELLRAMEVQPLTELGDEASVMFVEGNSSAIAAHGHALVRHGRFVAETVVLLDGDSHTDVDALIAKATEVAEITEETMQTVLSSDIQPLPVPRPETLTSYEMQAMLFGDSANPTEVSSIVTAEGFGCAYGDLGEAPQGIAELGGDAFERTDWNESWFPSTTDSSEFQSGKDFCLTWSPHLEESYLGDLMRLQEGHVGISNGRQTLSYWLTKSDLIEAGVLTATDNMKIRDFQMIVDRAGPWLVSLSVEFEGDAEAIRRLVRLDIPDLESTHSFSIDIGYGIIDDGTETWADRLDAWIQPRP